MSGKKLSGGAREQAERQVEEIKSFLEQWRAFLNMIRAAHRGRDISREDESEFLKAKAQLAQRHQYLLNWLDQDYVSPESITAFLRSCVTLRMIQGYEREFYQKLERSWHTTCLRLNLTLGRFRYMLDEEFS